MELAGGGSISVLMSQSTLRGVMILGIREGWTRSCTKCQIVELVKESLQIDLLWWIEAVPSLIPEQTSCTEGAN